MSDALKIALLGAGQLGGSFALALRAADPSLRIIAYDIDGKSAALLMDIGGATAVAATPADAVRDADIVVLAAPVRAFRALAETIAPSMKPSAILTDVGSVKASMAPLGALVPQARLVPGHPIAGSEKAGVAVAKAGLFKGKLVILTPSEGADIEAVQAIETLWQLTGAEVLAMPTEVHDQIYAQVSHLPHLIAFVAAAFLHRKGIRVTTDDAVLQRFLRIGRSNPRMWTDIFLENREALLPALAAYTAILQHFASELRHGEAKPGDALAITKAHLPRILAASLISSVSLYEQQAGIELRPFGAGGMRDIAAPAAEDPEAVMQAMSDNATLLADALEAILPDFAAIEQLIGAEDEPALFAHIDGLVRDAETLTAPRQ